MTTNSLKSCPTCQPSRTAGLVRCRDCGRPLTEDVETAATVDWSGRIYIVTPKVQETMEAEGWCISNSDRHGWCVERDDENPRLSSDEEAWRLAAETGVPLDHRGRLTKYPIHFRSLEPLSLEPTRPGQEDEDRCGDEREGTGDIPYRCQLSSGHTGDHVDTSHPMHPSWPR